MNQSRKSQPRYQKNDKVGVYLIDTIMERTIKDFQWNGYTWMYSFEETEMKCGEQHLCKIPKKDTK